MEEKKKNAEFEGAKKQDGLNLSIYLNSEEHVDKYGKILDEHFKAHEKLDPKHLQGRPNNAAGKGGTKHGSAAEVLHTKDKNIESIRNGGSTQTSLSDSAIDPVTDIVTKDINTGKIVDRAQVKFYKSPEDTVNAFAKGRYSKNGSKIVPKDQYEEVVKLAKQKAREKLKEAETFKKQGDMQKYTECVNESRMHSHTAKHAKPATRDYKDAKDASSNKMSRHKLTAKETLADIHEAGLKQAGTAAALSGGISAAQNITSVIKGEKDIGEAAIDTMIDTAKGAVCSYGVTTSSVILKSGLNKVGEKITHEGAKGVFKSMAKGNGPTLIVTSTLEVGKSLVRYADGEIDGEELIVELGEKGTGILVSTMAATIGAEWGLAIGTTVGTITLPGGGTLAGAAIGSFVGGVIGGMVGYMASSQMYYAVIGAMSKYSRDSDEYRRLAALYEQAYRKMKAEREYFEYEMNKYHVEKRAYIFECFNEMEKAVNNNQAEIVNDQLNNILSTFGQSIRFSTLQKFDDMMLDDTSAFKL